MRTSREPWGTTACGKPVNRFTLTNARGMAVRCIDYGCRVTGIVLPTASGEVDVALGLDALADYERDGTCQGALVGRYANRIKGASFALNGKKFGLAKGCDGNYLHGSFHRRVFDAEICENGVVFTRTSPDGEDGFPGNLCVQATYSLDNENRLAMTYVATTDADTVINLTNHTYFDLSGGADADVCGHVLQMDAPRFLETDADLCPTGKIFDVAGTPFDFTKPKRIGADIEQRDEQLARAHGYDHCFVLREESPLREAAAVSDASGKIRMRVRTTQPTIHFYSGNFLDGSAAGKGVRLTARRGFCLETGHCPDSPNRPAFPTTILRAGETYRHRTELRFDFR